jgi:transcription-repair coupling factor (superfamily II helicase)
VHFKDLGLLIVDEEQRFGVSHKERLKELSVGVDVLTLSATPIPRTLNMALSGLRDMSTIEEPPQDRYPVQTFVLEFSERVLDDAVRRELERGGQVYYLHNRVESIDTCAAQLKKRFPEAEIAVAHGKMNEEQLGDVMQRMADGEVQILVCTTIIETGIDIPNVNTLIIEDADKLGLASCTSSAAASAARAATPSPISPSARARCSRRSRKSASRPSANTRSSAPASRSRCATSRSAARATFWARSSPAT